MLEKDRLDRPWLHSRTVDPEEMNRFAAMAEEWWNPEGKFRPILAFNKVRRRYIVDRIARHFHRDTEDEAALTGGLRILDVGCGAGLLCEALLGRRPDGDALWPLSRFSGTIVAMALAFLLGMPPGVSAAEKTALWRALGSGGHVALLRHAVAPGTGDPPEFALGDCGTQRNLSDQGREQAARIGARFRVNSIEMARVFSSQWCRCLETAKLLGLSLVEELPALNSFFQRSERREPQTQALEEWLAGQDLDGPLVLVTHQVNITALTGVYPASGELVVVRRAENGALSVVGSIETD